MDTTTIKKPKVTALNVAHWSLDTKRYFVLNDVEVKGVPPATDAERLFLIKQQPHLFI